MTTDDAYADCSSQGSVETCAPGASCYALTYKSMRQTVVVRNCTVPGVFQCDGACDHMSEFSLFPIRSCMVSKGLSK